MAKVDNEELVQQFRNYLERSSGDQKALPEKLDLFSFYSEMTALKNEVKIESRLIKQGLDSFKETAGGIEQGNAKLDSLLQASRAEQVNNGEKLVLRPVLQGLLDLYDRIQASLRIVPESRMGLLYRLRLCRSNDGKVIHSMREGQKMTLERILALLQDCGVHPIESSGCRFDPLTMRAVETDALPELADGMVSAELRTGFTWNDAVLRPAEVRVNRKQETEGR